MATPTQMVFKDFPINRFGHIKVVDLSEEEQTTVRQLAKDILFEKVSKGPVFDSPDVVKEYLMAELAHEKNEVFAVLWLDTRHRLLPGGFQRLFNGTIDGASVHPRVIVQRGLEICAGACLIAHNHPSGMVAESQADVRITDRVRSALELCEIRLLDHIIVGGEGAMSFAEKGLL